MLIDVYNDGMPELPELEVVCGVLNCRVIAETILEVKLIPPGAPVVVRNLTRLGFEDQVAGSRIENIRRRGKFLIFTLEGDQRPLYLTVNCKLSGRLQLAEPSEKKRPRTHVILGLANGKQLRYFDPKQMGQLYLTHDLNIIPGYADMGPDPLEIPLDEFHKRLKPFQGEIKGVLTKQEFVAGIGNAYADEILWAARLHPYRKRIQMTAAEEETLYIAMRSVLQEAVVKVREGMQEHIEMEPREFMAVHMKTGQPCPRCGTPVSLVGANQRITNFCRTCQPGGLIKGMN
jgi:formamidopyrimidine-DNA glycosylase